MFPKTPNLTKEESERLNAVTDYLAKFGGDLEVARSALLSSGFDYSTATKFFGDVKDVKDIILQKSGRETPFLTMLLNKGSRKIYSHTFEVKIEEIGMPADPSNYKIAENGTANTGSRDITTGSNNVMRVAVAAQTTLEAREVAVVPNRDEVIAKELDKAIQTFNFVKEYYLWFGDKGNANETSGLMTFLKDDTTSLGYYKNYTGSAGTNVLIKNEMDEAITNLVDNGAQIQNLMIFGCSKALQTISNWFEDKKYFNTDTVFSFRDLLQYPTAQGMVNMIPVNANVKYSTNVLNDKVVIMDTTHIGYTNLFTPITVDMPITFPLMILNRNIVESFGFDYGLDERFALFEGIDSI